MSHESDSASRHRNMLKSLRFHIPHVGALLPAIGFVRQPHSGHSVRVLRQEQLRHDTRVDVGQAAAVGVLAAVLLFVRVPQASRNFWAEDGNVFFGNAYNRGFIHSFLRPYQGYYDFVPRTIAAISVLVPLRAAATTTFVLVALVVAWCAGTAFLASRPWVQTLAGRVFLAISLVALPVLGVEALGNAANLQFTMLFVALLVLLSENTSRRVNINGAVFVIATGLSTPTLVGLVPVVVWRIARRRTIRPDIITWAWIAGTLGHLLPIAIVRPPRSSASVSLGVIANGYSRDVVRYNFSGFAGLNLGSATILAVSVIVLAGAAVSLWRGAPSRAALLLIVPATGVVVFVASASTQAVGGSHAHPLHVATRKDVFPALCLTWAVIVAVECLIEAFETRSRQTREIFASAAFVVLLLVWSAHWSPPPSRTSGTTWNEGVRGAARDCVASQKYARIAILPQPSTWYVLVRCSDVR
jgi:hypothetical protein